MLGFPKPQAFSSRDAIALIAIVALAKVAIAAVFPATIDEAYGIAVSRLWSLSYFDHPPLAFTLAQLTAWKSGTEAIWVNRLPFILMGSISAWLIYRITVQLFDAVAAFWALGWFLATPFFFISAGHFVVPDGPLNLALLAAFACLLPILKGEKEGTHWIPWLGFGAFLAIALTAKYQAVLFGISILLCLLTTSYGRKQLTSAPPWAAAFIATIGLLPMLIWNYQNDFISFSFQSSRATEDFGIQPANFLLTMLGQAIYLLPGTFMVALLASVRNSGRGNPTVFRALALAVLLPFFIFAVIALFSTKSLPHWPMAGFLFAFPFVGKWCAENASRFPKALSTTLGFVLVALPAVAFAIGLQLSTSFLTKHFTETKTGLDSDWRGGNLSGVRHALENLEPATPVYVRNWSRAGKLAHAIGPSYTVIPLFDPRHFQFATMAKKAGLFVSFQPRSTTKNSAAKAINRFLKDSGFTTNGEPRLTPIRSGTIVKYYLVTIGVTPL